MFSGVVKISDANDFIEPSKQCIKPLIESHMKPKIEENDEIFLMSKEKKGIIKSSEKNTAQINITDCLACSGCITSSETVLLEQDNLKKFLDITSSPENIVFLSISPQVRTSLASFYRKSEYEINSALNKIAKRNNIRY